MTGPNYVIRAIEARDAAAILRLRDLAGPGFTSLAVDDATLAARVAKSAERFKTEIQSPGADQRYMLALEHLETGAVVGLAAAKACVGEQPPFFNFRVLKISKASVAAERRFDMEVLILVNEFTGCSEVGSLFVAPEHRQGGVGRALAQSRYLLMAAAPHRFAEVVVSELRGMVDPDGTTPFWEHLGKHFFKMSFAEADKLSATTDNQFILDLMPKYPIYVDLLPEAARQVIGKAHKEGEGALKLLQWEGFRYDRVIDIFDGGPLVSSARDTVRTFRESRRRSLRIVDEIKRPRRSLLALGAFERFRCVAARAESEGPDVSVTAETAKALGAEPGESVLVWSSNED